MKIQNVATSRNNASFKGGMNNKFLLKGLETVSNHGATFTAGLCTIMPLTIRPLAILATPDVEKENKLYACANSICSGLAKFGLIAAISLPIEYAVKKIDKNPEKFLNANVMKKWTAKNTSVVDSNAYKVATQTIKLGTGFLTAIPKSMITIALIPFIMGKLFNHKFSQNAINDEPQTPAQTPSFKGSLTDKLAQGTSKILNKILESKSFEKYITKNQNAEQDIAKHISASTDVLLSGAFAYQTINSEKIKENRKKALIYNNVISTSITLLGGYSIDRLVKAKTANYIEKFKEFHKDNPKLQKYIQGINIVRPALIFAGIYYIILPMFSTYLAQKIDNYANKK